jgi:hypothetical protein
MFDLRWSMGDIDKDYNVPSGYEAIGYCNI